MLMHKTAIDVSHSIMIDQNLNNNYVNYVNFEILKF